MSDPRKNPDEHGTNREEGVSQGAAPTPRGASSTATSARVLRRPGNLNLNLAAMKATRAAESEASSQATAALIDEQAELLKKIGSQAYQAEEAERRAALTAQVSHVFSETEQAAYVSQLSQQPIVYVSDFDGTMNKTPGETTINSDFYRVVVGNKDGLSLSNQETMTRMIAAKFHADPTLKERYGVPAETIAQFKLMLACGVDVSIISKNNLNYIHAMLAACGLEEQELAKIKIFALDRNSSNIASQLGDRGLGGNKAMCIAKMVDHLPAQYKTPDTIYTVLDDDPAQIGCLIHGLQQKISDPAQIRSINKLPGKFDTRDILSTIFEKEVLGVKPTPRMS